ncbi:MAG: GEVED domain-containing protein, partial [Bacteroidota bacterium]
VTLSTAASVVNDDFVVDASFSESVTGLTLGDFNVTNGSKSGLSGSGASYSFTVSPSDDGEVTVRLPANRTQDAAGNQNTASNTLTVTYDSSISCDNVTSGGSIVGNETNCGPYDPASITNGSNPGGGSGALQYQWQTSFVSANGPWLDIGNSNANTYNPGQATVSAWYRRLSRREGCTEYAGISNVVFKEVETNCGTSGYCDSKGDFPWHEWIAGVKLGDFEHTSGKQQYSDFTSLTIDLVAGNNYNVELTSGFSYSTYDEYFRIWIDLNGDEDFEDAGEQVFQKIVDAPATGTTTASLTGSFTLPADAVAGTTRMRVSMSRDAYVDPCGTNQYGEVEDYTVNIASAAAANRALLYFTANRINQAVELNWTTNTEFKNELFRIQRSVDGFQYETIAEVASDFEHSNSVDYYFMDEEPMTGESYYRVQQVYQDGGFHFTQVRKVIFEFDADGVSIFPNPTTGELFVNLRRYADRPALMILSDQLGRELERTQLGRIPASAMLVDLSRYENGLYFLTVKVDGHREFTQKVVLNRNY